jgi:peptidoglycan/xylan/chitin deacetylase (PgdA/CDA1 family)
MGAIALTFDNLGEAADLERGRWSPDEALGRHPSVRGVLPWLLDELDALGLRATFCVEAINCELYPDAVREIDARGHELALHGWRHERWDELSGDREEELLLRGRGAFAALGVDARGFRPPGGEPTARTADLLAAHGFAGLSPAGGSAAMLGPVARVPFAWTLVDAYHRLESFAAQRRDAGDPVEPLGPDAAAARLVEGLRAAAAAPEATAMILHPFLMQDDARDPARRVLGAAAAGGAVPMRDVVSLLETRQ